MTDELPRYRYWMREEDRPPFTVGDTVRNYVAADHDFSDNGLNPGECGVVETLYWTDGWIAAVRGNDTGELGEEYMAYVFELVAPATPDHAAEIAALFGVT